VSATIAAVVRDALLSTAGVTNLVGAPNAARIFVSYRDITGYPCIVLTYNDNADVSPTIDRSDRLRKLAVDIDCIATTAKGSLALAEAVRLGLHGAAGTSRSTTVMEIRVSRETTTYDVGAEGDEGGYHITSVGVDAYYRSAAVTPSTIYQGGVNPNPPSP
jgi:hypothetical protein